MIFQRCSGELNSSAIGSPFSWPSVPKNARRIVKTHQPKRDIVVNGVARRSHRENVIAHALPRFHRGKNLCEPFFLPEATAREDANFVVGGDRKTISEEKQTTYDFLWRSVKSPTLNVDPNGGFKNARSKLLIPRHSIPRNVRIVSPTRGPMHASLDRAQCQIRDRSVIHWIGTQHNEISEVRCVLIPLRLTLGARWDRD